jgi:hypothetical protein
MHHMRLKSKELNARVRVSDLVLEYYTFRIGLKVVELKLQNCNP